MRISIVNNLALFIGMLQVNLTHNLTIDGKPFFLQQKATVMFLGNMSDRKMFADCVFLNPYSAAFTEKKHLRLQILDSSTSKPWSVKPGLKFF